MPTDRAEWQAAWTAELDRLEISLDEAESLLRSNDTTPAPAAVPDWTPLVQGLLPATLLPRAQCIHARQLEVARALAKRAVETHKQSELTRVIRESTARPEVPIYLDISA